ncbi:MAG: beta strand repeat-containing protein [Gemmataceae bacterium]
MNLLRSFGLLLAIVLFAPTTVQAQSTYTWNGGSGGSWGDGTGGWLDPGNNAVNWSNFTSLIAEFAGTGPTTVTVNAGGVMVYGLSFAADGYIISGGAITFADISGVGGTTGQVAVGTGFTATINSSIGGSSALLKTGAGTLVLGAANSYIGGTVVSAGTLLLSGSATLGSSGSGFSVNNNATLDLGGTTQIVGSVNGSGANGLVGSLLNGTLNLNGNNMFVRSGTVSANLTGGGGSRLWIGGDTTATVLLGGVNTINYFDTHSTIIGHPLTGDVGIVRIISPTALGPASQEAQLFTGTLDLNGQTNITAGNLAFFSGGNSRLVNGNATTPASHTGTIELLAANTDFRGPGNISVAGVVFGPGGFNKSEAGTLTFQNAANSYTGTTILTGGILNVASLSNYGVDGGLGNRPSDPDNNDIGLLFRGGTLQYTGSTPQSTNRTLRVSTDGGGGTIDASGSNPSAILTFNAATTPNFWENGGNRTLTLTGTNTGANTLGIIVPDIPGVTTSAITKDGPGTWHLTRANTYRGITTFAAGILNVASLSDYDADGALGNRPSGVDGGENVGLLFRGGTLQYTGSTPQSTNRTFRLSTIGGGGTIDASGTNPSATLTFNAATTPNYWENPGSRTLTLTGTNTGANTLAMVIPDIPGATTSGITKTGPGTWFVNAPNTYRGPTLINDGILRIQNATALGIGGFDGITKTDVAGTGTLEIDGSFTIDEHFHFGGSGAGGIGAVRVVSGSTTFTTSNAFDDNGSGTAVINVLAGASLTFGNVMYSDAQAGLTKIGSGTLILGAANTYPVGTNINGGTLQLGATNAIPSTGTVRLSGGTLRTGATTGFSNNAGILNVNGTGTIELGTGSHTLNFAAFDSTNFTGLTIFGWTGDTGLPGTQGRITFTDPSALTPFLATIQFDGFAMGALIIGGNELVPVPEPLGLLAAGFAGAWVLRRCKVRRKGFRNNVD